MPTAPSKKNDKDSDITSNISKPGGKPSSAGTRLDKLRSAALHFLDLKSELDANAYACDHLFDLARFVNGFVQGTTMDLVGSHDVEQLSSLNDVLGKISSFKSRLDEDSSAGSTIFPQKDRLLVESYSRELSDKWSRYQADMLHRLLNAKQKAESEEQHKASLPIPIEQLLPILPKHVSIYVGHEEELRDLVAILDGQSPHVVILGVDGIGKTALATKAMWDPGVESKFGGRRFFISCDALISADGIVSALASCFKVTESRGASKQQALLAHLHSLRVPILIVLDGLEAAWDTDDQNAVETFLSNLCAVDLLAVVVTMRGASPPDGPRWHKRTILRPLNLQQAQTLFTEIYPESAAPTEERGLHELLELLGGIPLAITSLAFLGRTGYTPSELLDQYHDEGMAMVKRGRGKTPENIGQLNGDVNLSRDVDANADVCEELFKHACLVLEKTQGAEGQHITKSLSDLKGVLDEIFVFEKKLGKNSEARSIALADEHQSKAAAYRKRLDDAWSLRQADTLHSSADDAPNLATTSH